MQCTSVHDIFLLLMEDSKTRCHTQSYTAHTALYFRSLIVCTTTAHSTTPIARHRLGHMHSNSLKPNVIRYSSLLWADCTVSIAPTDKRSTSHRWVMSSRSVVQHKSTKQLLPKVQHSHRFIRMDCIEQYARVDNGTIRPVSRRRFSPSPANSVLSRRTVLLKHERVTSDAFDSRQHLA